MDFLANSFSEQQLQLWEKLTNDWFFLIALALLCAEFMRYGLKKTLTKNMLGDALTNFITFFMFIGINILIAGLYFAFFFGLYEYYSLTKLPVNIWIIALCILLADFIYYWEHRTMHRTGLGWATHTVHHSSPYFNISVAYRFGPLDGIIPIVFHVPLALIGFNPFVIIFSELMVQLYQTLLHTETVDRFPQPVEAVMNTPSHHRVHHGSNLQYIDKNYAGIFIIWDKMFGTFEQEDEKVVYGVLPPINSVNPLRVFLDGLASLFAKIWQAKGLKNKFLYLVKPPGWHPTD